MKSELERAISFIDSMTATNQIRFLTRIVYELTIAGRTTYSFSSSSVDKPECLRIINELQHRVAGVLIKLELQGQSMRLGGIVELFLADAEPKECKREVRRSFLDALAASVSQETERLG